MNDTRTRPKSDVAALLARIGLGEQDAVELLYRAVGARLFGVILRINPDRAQAEEILQEVFVSIWRRAGSFEAARAEPMAWLNAIARNGAIDSLRRAQTRLQTVSAHGIDSEGAECDLAEQTAAADASPLALLQEAADRRNLAHCVRSLSAEQQQCVALAYYQGLSHAEVASHLVQPLGTVKGWLRRALMSLRDCLGRSAGWVG